MIVNGIEVRDTKHEPPSLHDKEFKAWASGKLSKDEAKGVEKILMANKPDDGVTGESTLWKLVQGITAHSRELEPRRQRYLQEIAGNLMDRVKL